MELLSEWQTLYHPADEPRYRVRHPLGQLHAVGELLEMHGNGDFCWGDQDGLLDAATVLIYVGGGQYYVSSSIM